ncbi:MAG: cytochrome c [Deltaproteobacteria bacterium]|nr:cytochrome c [Deltaproteobacteria bacterium]
MHVRKILPLLFLLGACSVAPLPQDTATPAVEGARLFKAKGCTTCHTIGGGVKVGPDLQGLFSRREEAWIRRYIADPVTMVEQDPIARELKAQYKIQMPKMMISPAEMDRLLAYLREAGTPTKP